MNVSCKGVPQCYNSCTFLLKPIYFYILQHRNTYSKLFHKQSRGLAAKVSPVCCCSSLSVLRSDQQTSNVAELHNHKSHRVRSGLGQGYAVVPRRSIHRLGKRLSSHALIGRAIISWCCILREYSSS